jgi:hypothetical protein
MVFFSLGLVYTLFGQEQTTIKIGFTQATISSNKVFYDMEWKGGEALGVSFISHLNGFLSFEPEINYVEYGYHDPMRHYDVYFNYYAMAALFRLEANHLFTLPDKQIRLYMLAGPDLAITVNSNKKTEFGLENAIWNEIYDLGLILGGGAGYQFGFGRLFLEIRYNLGFVEIDTDEGLKNRAWHFLVGYSMDLNK